MGNTYECVVVGGLTQQQVLHHLQSVQDDPFPPYAVGPQVEDMVGLVSEGGGSFSIVEELSKLISQPVLLYGVYDSDAFYYSIYQNGEKIAGYFSNPEMEGSDPFEEDEFDSASELKDSAFDLLHRLFGKPDATLQQIEGLIQDNNPNAAMSGLWLYDELFLLLKLPPYVQGLDYESLVEGDFPQNTHEEDFVLIS